MEDVRRAWQHQVAYVPQTIALLDDTVRANIELGAPATTRSPCGRRCGPPSSRRSSPSCPTASTPRIGERGVRLSGGQRQRLGVARALYRRPARARARRGHLGPRQRDRGPPDVDPRRPARAPSPRSRSRTGSARCATPTAPTSWATGGSSTTGRSRSWPPATRPFARLLELAAMQAGGHARTTPTGAPTAQAGVVGSPRAPGGTVEAGCYAAGQLIDPRGTEHGAASRARLKSAV